MFYFVEDQKKYSLFNINRIELQGYFPFRSLILFMAYKNHHVERRSLNKPLKLFSHPSFTFKDQFNIHNALQFAGKKEDIREKCFRKPCCTQRTEVRCRINGVFLLKLTMDAQPPAKSRLSSFASKASLYTESRKKKNLIRT